MTRVERIGNATLYLGDCREVLPTLDRSAAIVTDPPYGINFRWTGADRNGRASTLKWGPAGARNSNRQPDWRDIVGDDAPFDPIPWLQFSQVILWGGNNYVGLPPARRWLVWDKRRDTAPDDHGDAELAWTNLPGVIRMHRQVWRGIVREGRENIANEAKFHPTQKPITLMSWCINMTEGAVIDPYMGSGSTGVAAAELGRPFVGCEIEQRYFDIACKRIEATQRQGDMFSSWPPAEDPADARMALDAQQRDLFAMAAD